MLSRFSALCGIVAVLLTVPAVAAQASASTVASSQAFRQWGDNRWYEPLPGGQIDDRTSTPWSLVGWYADRGSPRIVADGTPWNVWGSARLQAYQLPPGSQVEFYTVSPHADDVRFFAKSSGTNPQLEVVINTFPCDWSYSTHVLHRFTGTSTSWAPTPALSVPDTRARAGEHCPAGYQGLALVIRAVRGTWTIDDISIDPWKSGRS